MSFRIASIQIGSIVREGDPESREIHDRFWTTGFYKQPVSGPVLATRLGIQGDSIADTVNHGGPDKAILCYAASHYDQWRIELPELNMPPGSFGENLTLASADESTVCLADLYTVGECVVQVSQPRQPCWKISRRWGIKTLTKTVTQTGRTGWYLRVLRSGSLQAGDQADLIERLYPQWPVARANDVLFGRETDRMAVIELMQIRELADAWKSDLA